MTGKNKTSKKPPRKGLIERRDKILEAAVEVFAEKGFERATIDDIAERAGVGKGTIYRRVGKKQDFTDLLLQHAAKLTFDGIEMEIKKRTDPLLQFKEAVYALCDVYERNLSLMMLVCSQMALQADQDIKKSSDVYKHKDVSRLFDLVEGILCKAVEKGQIRHVDTHTLSKGLFEFLNPYYYRYLRFKCNYTKGEIAQLTIDLFLDGLRSKEAQILGASK